MKYNENNNIITMDIENAILHVLAMMRNVHHPFLVGRRRYNTDVRVKDINVGFFFFQIGKDLNCTNCPVVDVSCKVS